MKLISNNETFELENKNGKLEINEKPIDFSVEMVSKNKFRITKGDFNTIALGIKNKDKYYVNIEGQQYVFTEIDNQFEADADNSNKAEILPPMPGAVVKILVKEKDEVEEGTPLIVVEAMKMETTLYSPISGIVTQIKVTEKQQVNPEDYMILIEKELS